MEQISIGWLVLEMTNSPGQVALVGFYRSAPYLIFGFLMGVLTDRFGYRRTILFAQTLSLSVIGTLFMLLWAGHLRLWHVAVGAFLIGTSWTLDWPARQALVPDLVGREQTLDALMISNFSQNLSSIAGPFVGGVLLDTFDVQGCFLALIVLYLTGLAALSRLAVRSNGGGRAARIASPWGDLKESLRYIRGSERITAVLLITVFMNALAFPYQTLLPVFARDVLHRGPLGLGVLGASIGIGSFLGVLVVNWIKRFRRSGWVFAGGSLLLSTALILFAVSKSYSLSVAILICGGMGMAGFSVMQTSILLVSSSDAMRNRVMGALVLAIGGGPPGNLQIGALTTMFGAPLALGISCGVAVAAVAGTTMAFPGFRAQDGRADRVKG